MSLSVFVNADNSGIYNNPETERSLKNYLLSDSAAGVDVNHDGTVNILDLIDYKAAALDIDLPEGAFKLSSIPKYSGTPYAVVNDNVPFFRYKGYTFQLEMLLLLQDKIIKNRIIISASNYFLCISMSISCQISSAIVYCLSGLRFKQEFYGINYSG